MIFFIAVFAVLLLPCIVIASWQKRSPDESLYVFFAAVFTALIAAFFVWGLRVLFT